MDIIVKGAMWTAWSAAATVVTAVAPLVSTVAVPIFAIKAALRWNEHRILYNRTLTPLLTREKFGRISGQNYMHWDGKTINQEGINSTQNEKKHEALGFYVHGYLIKPCFIEDQGFDSSFNTQEDLEWLRLERTRREKKDLLDNDLKMLRAFAKALIPIIGVIWVSSTELSQGGASTIGLSCGVCPSDSNAANTHWQWREAINFHISRLTKQKI